ncbi:uncharacterized protein LOC113859403 [Abrus precatorius]|uniref:Uncharacterized protein LOC113859403 n=1 Tax=Abrus precatorius TaxID=3816 RepID=A0A8B8KXB3_ABRPR|nr:uncharacterized protein LOC113859403 [Abrus precatorius]
MVDIIDLTDAPPSPPRSSNTTKVLKFADISVKKYQFKKNPISSRACAKSNSHRCSQQQTTPCSSLKYTYEPSHIASRFQLGVHDERIATVPAPVPESNTYLFPQGARLNELWSQTEHELFLRGIIKYGRGHWSEIAKHFLPNKTAQEIQSYATSFFTNLPSAHHEDYCTRKQTFFTNSLMPRDKMSASPSNSMPMIDNKSQQTLMLFPEEDSFLLVLSNGEASSNTKTDMYGSQMQTGGENTSMNASVIGEVDLELRLGRCK